MSYDGLLAPINNGDINGNGNSDATNANVNEHPNVTGDPIPIAAMHSANGGDNGDGGGYLNLNSRL